MDKVTFAENTLKLLCEYVGDDKVFEALLERWGVEETFKVIAAVYQQVQEAQEGEESIDSEGDAEQVYRTTNGRVGEGTNPESSNPEVAD
jgi:hypothetical protein